MLKRRVHMSEEKARLLKHKADLHMQQINAKYLISKESKGNIAKCHKMEKEDKKAEIASCNKQAVSTIEYYSNNMVSSFIFLCQIY